MRKKKTDTRKKDTTIDRFSPASIKNSVLAMRKARGMTQSELAIRVGLTRQTMYAIEVNQYLPNTAISLRLAQALGCRIDDLFSLSPVGQEIEAELLEETPVGNYPLRVKVSQVGDRMIARPVSYLGDILNFVVSADGIVTGLSAHHKRKGHGLKVRVNLLQVQDQISQHIMIAGCDPSLCLAREYLRYNNSLAGVTNWTMGSTNALKALLDGEVHIAGVHLVDSRSGESNLPYLKRHVRGEDFIGVRFASWVQGLLVQQENPKGIRAVEDLANPRIQIVNREVGAGARFLLDTLLKKAGISGECVKGYEQEVLSHLEVGRLIRDGLADAGIGIESVARHYGLKFIPLRNEHYDLILRKKDLTGHPMISPFLNAMVSRPFRQELQAMGGYNLAEIGKSLNW